MNREELERRCRNLLQLTDQDELGPQTLIGVFQRFRDQPELFETLFTGNPIGEQVGQRVAAVISASGSGTRATGGQDAYLIVRNYEASDPELIHRHGVNWLHQLYRLYSEQMPLESEPLTFAEPLVRVLEGIPPKQLKADEQSLPLLRWLKRNAGMMTQKFEATCAINQLFREACYFMACDTMLRDYVLWPTYASSFQIDDPFADYFALWQRGIKWRVFSEDTVDLYIPRT